MIPLRDGLTPGRFGWLTLAILVACCAVFAWEITFDDARLARADGEGTVRVTGFEAAIVEWAFRPCELVERCEHPGVVEVIDEQATTDLDDPVVAEVRVTQHPALVTLMLATFMHGSWEHLIGNLLFLWVFANNVEDALGRLRFTLFYLLCGLAAGLVQLLTDPASGVPNLGASGAIAGMMGAYLVLHPRVRVLTLFPILPFLAIASVPAVLVLGGWIGLQLVLGAASLLAPQGVGVAFFAHIGGFAVGAALIRLALLGRRRPPSEAHPLAAG